MTTAAWEVLYILLWLGAVKFFQLSLYPLLEKRFSGIGYALSFSASILLFGLLSWYCGLFTIPPWVAVAPFVLLLALAVYRREITIRHLQKNLCWDALFLVFFLFLLQYRLQNPTFSYGEAFMDHAFIASIIRNPVVPPLDPWFAGGTLDMYYYLGHWISAGIATVSHVPSTVAFNLILPTVLGLAAVNAAIVGSILLPRFRWLPVASIFLFNPALFAGLFGGSDLTRAFWDSTRVVAGTINEYPLFTFLFGTPHANAVELFNLYFLLALLALAFARWGDLDRRGHAALIGLSTLSLGTIPALSGWEVFLYGPLVVIVGSALWLRYRGDAWQFPAFVPILAVLAYLPFYLAFRTAGVAGIGIVPVPSDPLEFVMFHGIFLVFFILYTYEGILARPYILLIPLPLLALGHSAAALAALPAAALIARHRFGFCDIIAIAGLATIILCEFFYFVEVLDETAYFRMNTVFKFYEAAWVLLGLSATVIAADRLCRRDHPGLDRIAASKWAAGAAAIGILIVPVMLPVDFGNAIFLAGTATGECTLDGTAYLQERYPDDLAGMQAVRSLPPGSVIVEAVSGDYSYASRISSCTGVPAILGMPFHEYQWRGNEGGWFWERRQDIADIYEDPELALLLMEEYGATHLYVGAYERELYQVNLPETGLEEVFSRGETMIYRRTMN